MTDKEKIREEIEKIKIVHSSASLKDSKPDILVVQVCTNLLSFIDSLQEEPVSIWHDGCEIPKSETNILMIRKEEKDSNYPPIAGCFHGLNSRIDGKNWGYYNGFCYNEIEAPYKWAYVDDFLALEEIPPKFPLISQKKCMFTKDSYTDEGRKVLCDGCEEECKYAQKEEPVSDECIYNRTLEERQRSCKFCSAACQVRIKEPVSEVLEEEAAIYIERFLDGDLGFNPRLLHSNAKLSDVYNELNMIFKAGAKWNEKQMMAKAVDGDITFDYYGDGDKTYGCIAHDSFCLEDFGLKDRDKVKMILIKE